MVIATGGRSGAEYIVPKHHIKSRSISPSKLSSRDGEGYHGSGFILVILGEHVFHRRGVIVSLLSAAVAYCEGDR